MKINNNKILKTCPKLVVFDLDNTLYDYESAHTIAMSAVVEKVTMDLDVEPGKFKQYLKQAKMDVKKSTGNVAASHSRLLYFKRTFELIGLGTLVLKSLDLEQTYWRTFMSNANLFDNVHDFLHELSLHGISTAIITDLTTQIQFRKLVSFNLENAFDYIITSEEAGAEKPNKAPFNLLLEKVGDISPIWMIGDDIDKDIYGSQQHLGAFGMLRSQTLTRKSHNVIPDAYFSSFLDLASLIQRIQESKQ